MWIQVSNGHCFFFDGGLKACQYDPRRGWWSCFRRQWWWHPPPFATAPEVQPFPPDARIHTASIAWIHLATITITITITIIATITANLHQNIPFPTRPSKICNILWISEVVFLYFSENLCLETAGECSDIRRCPKGAVLPLYLYHGHALLLVSKYQYLCPNIAPARQWIIDGALGAIEMYIGRSHPGHTALTWMLHLV